MSRRPSPNALYCCYCKRPLTPAGGKEGTSLTFDHVRPMSTGGKRKVPCCRKCNNLKDDLHMVDWFWFIRAFPRWWKTFSTPDEVMIRVREEYRRRAYANAGRELPV